MWMLCVVVGCVWGVVMRLVLFDVVGSGDINVIGFGMLVYWFEMIWLECVYVM